MSKGVKLSKYYVISKRLIFISGTICLLLSIYLSFWVLEVINYKIEILQEKINQKEKSFEKSELKEILNKINSLEISILSELVLISKFDDKDKGNYYLHIKYLSNRLYDNYQRLDMPEFRIIRDSLLALSKAIEIQKIPFVYKDSLLNELVEVSDTLFTKQQEIKLKDLTSLYNQLNKTKRKKLLFHYLFVCLQVIGLSLIALGNYGRSNKKILKEIEQNMGKID